jgi:hypothetical protein
MRRERTVLAGPVEPSPDVFNYRTRGIPAGEIPSERPSGEKAAEIHGFS